jgi:hypothetical protein
VYSHKKYQRFTHKELFWADLIVSKGGQGGTRSAELGSVWARKEKVARRFFTVVFTDTTNGWRSSTSTAACSCLRGHRTDRKPRSTRPRASTELKKKRAVALFFSEREQTLFKKATVRPQSVLPKNKR